MPPRTKEQSKQTADNALRYAKQFLLRGSTHPQFGTLTPDLQKKLFSQVGALRRSTFNEYAISLGLDVSVNFFYTTIASAKATNIGNCQENACLALDYVTHYETDAYAEVYHLERGIVDHAICVIDRKKDSDPKNPATWGENAYVCDPWGDEVYPASNLAQPKTYQMTRARRAPKPDDYENIEVACYEVTFNPKKHTIAPQKNLNSDYIRETQSIEHIDSVIDIYQKKSAIVLTALETFGHDLDKLAKKLSSGTGVFKQEKASIITAKLAAVQKEIARFKQDLSANIPTQNDYFTLRSHLENRLRQSTENTRNLMTLSQSELETIGKQENPKWDKFFGKGPAMTKTAAAVRQSIEKTNTALDSLYSVKSDRPPINKLTQTSPTQSSLPNLPASSVSLAPAETDNPSALTSPSSLSQGSGQVITQRYKDRFVKIKQNEPTPSEPDDALDVEPEESKPR